MLLPHDWLKQFLKYTERVANSVNAPVLDLRLNDSSALAVMLQTSLYSLSLFIKNWQSDLSLWGKSTHLSVSLALRFQHKQLATSITPS